MAIIKIQALGDYRCREVVYVHGAIFELEEAQARKLLADAPGTFMVIDSAPPVGAPPKTLEAPPMDKMVRSAPMRKGKGK